MKLSSKLLMLAGGVVMTAGISGTAQAGTLTLDGITVPAGVIGRAEGTTTIQLDQVDVDNPANNNTGQPGAGTINVFGNVSEIGEAQGNAGIVNSTWHEQFANPANTELTFVLSVTANSAEEITDNGSTVGFRFGIGGSISYYTDPSDDYDEGDPSSAGPGNLWLTAELINEEIIELYFDGQVLSIGEGGLEFAVTGGPWEETFATGMLPDGVGGADIINFSLNADSSDTGFFLDGQGRLNGATSADTHTDFFAVPEPAALGLFGIGLIGLGALSRRRKA